MKKVIINSFIAYILMMIIMYVIVDGKYIDKPIYYLNYFTAITFYGLLYYKVNNSNKINSNNLAITIIIYSMIYIMIYNILFYAQHGTPFEFNAVDSLRYHNYAMIINKMNLFEKIKVLFNGYDKFKFDDMGFTVYVSILYNIAKSNIVVNIFNILLVVLSSLKLYKLSTKFMSNKSSYLVALIYATSSYTIYLQSTGLKEILMNTIIIISITEYYEYMSKKKIRKLINAIIASLLLVFFRVPIAIFLLASFATYYLFYEKKISTKIFTILLIAFILYFIYSSTSTNLSKYMISYSDLIFLKTGKNEFIGLPPLIIPLISFFVGIIGPLPTILPKAGIESLSIYSTGLLLKVYLSVYFILGSIKIIKEKNKSLIPLLFFTIIEIISISFLWQTFEVRKVITHFPFVILIALYYIENAEKRRRMIVNITYIIIPILIMIWNIVR